jgi:hypothetical protein
MNNTHVLVAGASVLSLAVGGAAGYFLARRNFDKTVDDLILQEVAKTEKHFSVLLNQARGGKPDSPAELFSEARQKTGNPEQRKVIRSAERALTDYQGAGKMVVADKPDPATLVNRNIFTDEKPKLSPPARDPHFDKPQVIPDNRAPEDPYLITEEAFFANEPDWDQETLVYFSEAKTLIVKADPDETIDLEEVGEVNLTLFPEVP